VSKTTCALMIALLAAFTGACTRNEAANANDNANAAATAAAQTTKPAPDDSEVTTSVDANGTRTETRVFKNNPRISKVVVTTRDGRRTVKAYSASGEEREVTNTDENVLEATGDKVAAAAGWVADKAEDVPGETKSAAKEVGDKAEDVKDKTVSTSKKVGEKTVDVSKKVGEKTADTAKTVGDKTVEGAKKVGSATKKAVKKVIP
jgi:transcriptional regulator of met regulon